MPANRRGPRRSYRLRPLIGPAGDGAAALDRRILLSIAPMAAPALHHAAHVARPRIGARARQAHHAWQRIGPKAEINKQYATFYTAFQRVEASYVESLSQSGTGTVNASTTLTANYIAGSASMSVANAGVFGPAGPYSSPVTATAMVGSVPVGTFSLIGSSGNVLAIDVSASSLVSLASGTTLTAQVTTSASSSAGSIFPNYIMASTQQLAGTLVADFDSLPIKLPRKYAAPHQTQLAGAIQQYVYQEVAGAGRLSLQSTLRGITLPQTPGSDLEIYDTTVKSVIEASRAQMLNAVQQIFANKLPVIPSGSSTTSSSTSTTSSSSGTGGTGSTSSRVA